MPPTTPIGPTDAAGPADPAGPAAPSGPSPTPDRARRTGRDPSHRRRGRPTAPGWSAPAIIATVFGVAWLTGFSLAGLLSALDPPGRGDTAVRWDLHRLVDEIARYRREVGRVPPSLEALGLRNPHDGRGTPRGRGLKLGDDGVPLDPWGAPYEYAVLDEGRGALELRTAADDRILGTADDVVARPP